MKIVFGFSDSLVLYGGIFGLTFGIFGAASGGFLVKRFVSPTKVLMCSALLYMICACVFSLTDATAWKVFFVLAFSGIAYGLVFSLGRAIYAQIIPINAQNEYFGIFTVFERMAAVVGPLLWTLTFLLMKTYGPELQYRVSTFVLGLIALLGFLVLYRFHKQYGIFSNSETI